MKACLNTSILIMKSQRNVPIVESVSLILWSGSLYFEPYYNPIINKAGKRA